MARHAMWTKDAQLLGVHRWRASTGALPSVSDLRSACGSPTPLPSLRTVQQTWGSVEAMCVMYRAALGTWAATVRDPWTLQEVEFLDWEDVGFWFPIETVVELFGCWRSLRQPGELETIGPFACAEFWRWANLLGYAEIVATELDVSPLADLDDRARAYVLREMESPIGAPPRVVAITPAGGGSLVATPQAGPGEGLSRSALRRVTLRAARDGLRFPGRQLCEDDVITYLHTRYRYGEARSLAHSWLNELICREHLRQGAKMQPLRRVVSEPRRRWAPHPNR